MAEIKSRIVHKHDIEANWLQAVNFIPRQGEIIIYDAEVTENGDYLPLPTTRRFPYPYERFKIGDGFTNVNDLPFGHRQADWHEIDSEDAAFILNKPAINTQDNVTIIQGGNAAIVIRDDYRNDEYTGESGESSIRLTGAPVITNTLKVSNIQSDNEPLNIETLAYNGMILNAPHVTINTSDGFHLKDGLQNEILFTDSQMRITIPEAMKTESDPYAAISDLKWNSIANKPLISYENSWVDTTIGNEWASIRTSGTSVDHANNVTISVSPFEQSGEEIPQGFNGIRLEGPNVKVVSPYIYLFGGQEYDSSYNVTIEQTGITFNARTEDSIEGLMTSNLTLSYQNLLDSESKILTLESPTAWQLKGNFLNIEAEGLMIQGQLITNTSFVPSSDDISSDATLATVLTVQGWRTLGRLEGGFSSYISVEDSRGDIIIQSGEWNDENHHARNIYLSTMTSSYTGEGEIRLDGKVFINNTFIDPNNVLPGYAEEDEGKVLQIVNGVPTWVALSTTAAIDNILKGGN